MLNRDHQDTRMGIRFFRDLPSDIRYKIGEYLPIKAQYKMRAVSREFHGPFKRLKFIPRQYYELGHSWKWMGKIIEFSFYPTFKLWEKDNSIKYFLAGAGVLAVTVPFASAPMLVAFSGAAVSGMIYDKIEPKIKEHKMNKNIRPFEGRHLTFRR